MKFFIVGALLVFAADGAVVSTTGQEAWVILILGVLSFLTVVVPPILSNRRIDRTKALAKKADDQATKNQTDITAQSLSQKNKFADYDGQFETMFKENQSVRKLVIDNQKALEIALSELRIADRYQDRAELHMDDLYQVVETDEDRGLHKLSLLKTVRPTPRKRNAV